MTNSRPDKLDNMSSWLHTSRQEKYPYNEKHEKCIELISNIDRHTVHLKEIQDPFIPGYMDSTSSAVTKAQHAPQEPWFFTGLTAWHMWHMLLAPSNLGGKKKQQVLGCRCLSAVPESNANWSQEAQDFLATQSLWRWAPEARIKTSKWSIVYCVRKYLAYWMYT